MWVLLFSAVTCSVTECCCEGLQSVTSSLAVCKAYTPLRLEDSFLSSQLTVVTLCRAVLCSGA
jgi:hypothetical protein